MPREVTVKGEYKVAAEEYKAYLQTLGDSPEPLQNRHHFCTPDPKWEVERGLALARERRAMLTSIRQDPFRPPRAVTVRSRGVALESY
jgi:hypothetical protein